MHRVVVRWLLLLYTLQLLVYGPHVGIDAEGNIGTVSHRHDGADCCCSSAIAAAKHVKSILRGDENKPDILSMDDQQQALVVSMLLPHGARLENSRKKEGDDNDITMMAELPFVMFDAQDALMQKIVQKGCRQEVVAGKGKIAILGGITINTCAGLSDYFLPLRFEVFNNQGEQLETILLDSSDRVRVCSDSFCVVCVCAAQRN